MSHPVLPTDRSISLAHIWVSLAADRRGQTLRLMAQLAFNLITAESKTSFPEKTHALPPHPDKNST